MTGCYAYCVLPEGVAPPAALTGLDGAAVRALDVARLALWVSDIAARPEPTIERARAHNAVVEAAMTEAVTPVPLRFGQWFPDAARLARLAAERAGEWRTRLAEFAGACEYGIRIESAGAAAARDVQRPTDGTVTPGHAHMLRLRERHAQDGDRLARAERIVARLQGQIGGIVLRTRVDRGGPAAAGAAFLIRRADAPAWQAAAAAVRGEFEPGAVTLTGPWPPYSFVE
jgi:hypothetical protein